MAIQGLEPQPVPRKGNISATGIYFVTDIVDVGDVGTMCWLMLEAADRARSISVMAYVVRHVHLRDIDGRDVTGVAFEFIPESNAAAAALQDFVKYVLSLRREGPPARVRFDAIVDAGEELPAQSSTVRSLTVWSLTLETNVALSKNEIVRVDVSVPGITNRVRVEGRVLRVVEKGRTPAGPTYDVEIAIERQTVPPAVDSDLPPAPTSHVPPAIASMGDDEVSKTIDDLLSAVVLPPPAAAAAPARAPRRTHLFGLLSQIALTTLLSLLDMEQMTGKLVVHTINGAKTDVFVRHGRIIDIEPLEGAPTPRARLGQLLAMNEGSFEFYVQPVDRADRVQASTTALLLDLSREMDEASRETAS